MPKKFEVEATQKQSRMLPDGSNTQVYIVWLKTQRGAKGQVEISKAVWQSDGLEQALEEEAEDLDKAFELING